MFYIFRKIYLYRLKKLGLMVGNNFSIQRGCIIDGSFPWLIKIGGNVTLAPNVSVFAHDASTKNLLGYGVVGLVNIKDNVFVGAGSIILPGVTIGENSIIGAGSIVSKDIPQNSLFIGSTNGRVIDCSVFLENRKIHKDNTRLFDVSYTSYGNVTEEKKQEMISYLSINKKAFIV